MSTAKQTEVAEVRFSVEEKLRNVNYFPPLGIYSVRISGVPDGLRKLNPPCYTPRLVAIGPLHRDNPHLKPMEDLKLSFLREFITMMNNNIDGIITFIIDCIEQIRLCYVETKNISQRKDLCEMMLLDSVFIIQIFLKKEKKDFMFYEYWWFCDLMHDLLLVENQIPLFIPYAIYTNHYCLSVLGQYHMNFIFLANNFFEDVKMASTSLPMLELPYILQKPSHFIGNLMEAHFPQVSSLPNLPSQQLLLLLTRKKSNKEGNWKFGVATASRLLQYGVKFEVSTNTTTSLVEIEFNSENGILTIPPIKVNDWTETLFRNLIAFEHCQHLTGRYVTDYIIFMDSLIDTPEDVNILTNKGIIQDDLQDPEKVSELFNNLYKEGITENRGYYFAELSRELNDYRRDWRHQWKAGLWSQWKEKWHNWMKILMDTYFNSPWSIIKFFAAVILLGLTLVQTLCSIYQAKGIKM